MAPYPGWVTKLANYLGFVSKSEALRLSADGVRAIGMDTSIERQGTANMRGGRVTFEDLRALAVSCDAVSNAIQFRVDQIRSTPVEVVPVKGYDEDQVADEIAMAQQFLSTPGGLGGPGVPLVDFLSAATYDLLSIGCVATYRRLNKGGSTYSEEMVDAATLKPLKTAEGWTPAPPEIAYEQYRTSSQQKVGEFTADEIRYVRYNARSFSRFGGSPTENVLMAILQYIAYDSWNLSWATDGDAEFTYWTAPQDTDSNTREQFDAVVAAINAASAGRKVVAPVSIPAGFERHHDRSLKEADFEETQVHLVRRIATAFGLNATVLGFEGAQYKVSQDSASERAKTESGDVTKLLLAGLLNDIIHDDLGLTRVMVQWEAEEKSLEPLARTLQAAGTKFYTVNDGRRMLGLPELEGGLVDASYEMTAGGPVVLGWTPGTQPPDDHSGEAPVGESAALAPTLQSAEGQAAKADEARWSRLARKRLREGHLEKALHFSSPFIRPHRREAIASRLVTAKSADDIRMAFEEDGPSPDITAVVAEELLRAVRTELSARNCDTL